MKAITCPQCGGLISTFLPRQPIVECDYCGAKVIADERFLMLESFDDEAAKFRSLAAPLAPEPFKPIIFPQDTPTAAKTGKNDDAAIISRDKSIGRVVDLKSAKRRLR